LLSSKVSACDVSLAALVLRRNEQVKFHQTGVQMNDGTLHYLFLAVLVSNGITKQNCEMILDQRKKRPFGDTHRPKA